MSNQKIGRSLNSEFHVDTRTMSPVAVPLRRIPMHKEHIVKELTKRYEELGLIERIDSPFRAATVLVEKTNAAKSDSVTDKYRLCIDYRALNRQITDSAWPAPFIEHCLDSASGSKFLSSIDFNNGYHQIPCTDEAKYALAFSPGVGFHQYAPLGMPQGVKSASSYFQQSMERTFRGLESIILPPFYDDVNMKGCNFEDHLINVRLVLARVRECGYTLNALKCKFFQIRLKYLGHIIEDGTITVDPSRASVIVACPVPTNLKSLRRFLGMAQFCSRFIPEYNDKVSALYHLTQKNVVFAWTEECQEAFNYVKSKLSSPPVLRIPSSSDTFILETDASDTGIGCCLKVESHGDEFIVGYHSEKLKDPECRWHIVEKEAYAILESTKKFRHYLIGKKFVLKTDNRILTYMKTSKSRKLSNWALQLSDFDFDIVHIPSSNNAISDYFSRMYENVNIISTFESVLAHTEVLSAQMEESCIKNAFSYLECKQNFDVETLGPLKRYLKMLSKDTDGLLRWKTKIVLPSKYREQVLEFAHDHPTSGHFAEDRTWANITSNYFWPGAQNDVINWVRSCGKCNSFDSKPYVNRPLQPIPSSDRFELVRSDGYSHVWIIKPFPI